jgi:formiminoglutamase
MDLSVFLVRSSYWDSPESTLFTSQVELYDDEASISGKQIAILGVLEARNFPEGEGIENGPDVIRSEFYKLTPFDDYTKIIDLGNITPGERVEDTYFALSQVCKTCIKANVLPIIIGGSQDLTFGQYKGYEELEQTVNVVTVDHSLDFGTSPNDHSASGYLNSIILHRPNFLFNYANVGNQRYYNQKAVLELMEKMYFDTFRLGEMQQNLADAEPVIRYADMVSFDVSAIRYSEMPATNTAGPNGFFGNEAAQLARYAGLSERLTSIGFYNYNEHLDVRNQGAKLVAQLIWFVIDGFHARMGDYPVGVIADCEKYMVIIDDSDDEMVFYKSHLTNRWWLEVQYPTSGESQQYRNHLVPCSYQDFVLASNQEVPDRWWKVYQKLV